MCDCIYILFTKYCTLSLSLLTYYLQLLKIPEGNKGKYYFIIYYLHYRIILFIIYIIYYLLFVFCPLGGLGGKPLYRAEHLSCKTEHSVFHPPRGERGEQKGSGRTQQPNLMGLGSQSEPTEERAPFCRVGFLVGNLRGKYPYD